MHDDVMAWKCFSHYWPFLGGTHGSMVGFPHEGLIMRWVFVSKGLSCWLFEIDWRSFGITVMTFTILINRTMFRSPCKTMSLLSWNSNEVVFNYGLQNSLLRRYWKASSFMWKYVHQRTFRCQNCIPVRSVKMDFRTTFYQDYELCCQYKL